VFASLRKFCLTSGALSQGWALASQAHQAIALHRPTTTDHATRDDGVQTSRSESISSWSHTFDDGDLQAMADALSESRRPQDSHARPEAGSRGRRHGEALSFDELQDIFKILDKNGDGVISHIEFIKGLKQNPGIANRLGMPAHIQQEDGTRDRYQLTFGEIDADDSKNIDFEELCRYYGVQRDKAKTLLPQPSTRAAPAASWARLETQRQTSHAAGLEKRRGFEFKQEYTSELLKQEHSSKLPGTQTLSQERFRV